MASATPATSAPTAREARPLRADARRNRARVLEAARAAFAADGLAVPLDDIARRAGVGAGTVYRHFPTKEALFEAVIVDRLDFLVEQARAALEASDASEAAAGDAFFEFLDTMLVDAVSKKDLADALAGAGVDLRAVTMESAARLNALLAELLARAQAAGAVRPGIEPADLHAIVVGALAAEQRRADAEHPGRIARLVCDGLRPPAL